MRKSNTQKKAAWIFLALVILWTGIIWGNSLQTAVQSSSQSMYVVRWIEPILNFLRIEPDFWHTFVRKAAHMTEFGLLGGLWLMFLMQLSCFVFRNMVRAWFACMAAALVDETIQLFIPGRAGMIIDVWIDLLGAAAVILAVGVILKLIHRIKRR